MYVQSQRRRRFLLIPSGEAKRPGAMITKAMYASPAATVRRIEPEGWITCTANNLSIINANGRVDWDGEEVLGDAGGDNDGGIEGGNVLVAW